MKQISRLTHSLKTNSTHSLVAVLIILWCTSGSARAQLVPLTGTVPPNLSDIEAPGPASPAMQLKMKIYFKIRNQQLFEARADPDSPEYRRKMSAQDEGAMFGPLQSDIDAVSSWLASEGFEVGVVSKHPPAYMYFTGTVEQAERAFHVSIVSSPDGHNFANTQDPLIPAKFGEAIQTVFGLSDLAGGGHGTLFNVPNQGNVLAFAPADLYASYGITPLHQAGFKGAGDCMALVETSDFLDAAVTSFDNAFGVTPASITIPRRVPTGQINPGINSEEVEALIDVEWAHAVAPDSPIRAYIGNDPTNPVLLSPVDAIQLAATDNVCSVISVSFNVCQAPPSFFTAFNSAVSLALSHGQSVFIQTGDFGAAGPGAVNPATHACIAGNTQTINEMAGNTSVTAVGGSQFTPTYDPTTNVQKEFVAESAWNQGSVGQGATGGGPSAVYPRPTYQVGPGVPNDNVRHAPDVSMPSGVGDVPGFFIGNDISGQGVIDCCFGGTSISTPIWAAIAKLAEQRKGAFLGNPNQEIYLLGGLGLSGGFHDVVTGNNNFNNVPGFSAGLAYDQTTGWGSADVTTFVNAFVFSRGLVASGIKGSNTTITSAEIYTPTSRTTGTFSSGGTFVDSRTNYGASPLPDGTFLVFGGVVSGTAVKTAGIYDPALGTFVGLGQNHLMPQKRESEIHAALLFTGKVFISGRDDTGQYVSTVLYDPVAKTFSSGPNQIAPPAGIHAQQYTQTLLADGRVLIQGGTTVSQLYDPILNSFSRTIAQPRIANRIVANSVLLPDGRVLIAGGDIGITQTATAEVYTPPPFGSTTDSYVQVGNMTETRVTPPMLVINTGKVLVMGSDKNVDLFDPSANAFSATGQMQVARGAYGFSRLNNGTVLVAGGFNGSDLGSAEVYDPAAGAFTLTSSLTTARNSPFDFAVK